MKRLISIVLALVLIFALAVPSFAVTADEQADSLKSGWGSGTTNTSPTGYGSSWFYRVLYWLSAIETSANSLVDSNGDIYGELSHIDSSIGSFLGIDVGYIQEDVNVMQIDLKNMKATLDNIYNYVQASDTELNRIYALLEDFEPYIDGVEGLITTSNNLLTTIRDDLNMLQEVHADADDLAFKRSQKENQEYIQDTYFGSDGDLSLNVGDLGILTKYVREFKTSFNYEETYGSPTPVSVISEYSDFFEWFSDSTGLAMDPSFQGSSGGIVTPPDLPEYSTVNILPYALTSTTSESIFAGTGYRNNRKFSGLNLNTDLGSTYFIEPDEFSSDFSVTGYFYCEPGDVFYFYNIDAGDIFVPNIYFGSSDTNILSGSFWEIYKPDSFAYPSLEPDENNVYSYTIPSLPAGTNPPNDIIACRFMFSGSLNSGSFISLNQYPFENAPVPDEPEPEPEPLVNWLYLGTTTATGTDIFNGIGYKSNTRYSVSSGVVSYNGLGLTGFIPVSSTDLVYVSNLGIENVGQPTIIFFEDGTYLDNIYGTLDGLVSDSNGVVTIDLSEYDSRATFIRVCFDMDYLGDNSGIYINQYPYQSTSVSTFSLRSSVPIDDSQAVVTSYYEQRQLELKRIRGGN